MLRGLNVECLAVREICSIVHDMAGAERDRDRGVGGTPKARRGPHT